MDEEDDFYNDRIAKSIRFCKEWQSKYWKPNNSNHDSRSSLESGSQDIRLQFSESHLENAGMKSNVVERQADVILISDSSDEASSEQQEPIVSVKSDLVPDSSCEEGRLLHHIPDIGRIAIISDSDDDHVPSVSGIKSNPLREPTIIPESEDDEISGTQDVRQNLRSSYEASREMVDGTKTLSERKKLQIAQWLDAHVTESQCESSFSQNSVISASCNNTVSSGNSSLERFEQHHETPNNRGKILKATTKTAHDQTLKPKETPKTPVNIHQRILPITSETPNNQNLTARETPKNSTKKNTGRQLTLENYLAKSKENGPKELGSLRKKTLQNQILPETPKETPKKNIAIEDCTDILDKLYGNKWRAVANELLPTTEMKQKSVPKINRAIQTEKKATKTNPNLFPGDRSTHSSQSQPYKPSERLKKLNTLSTKESRKKVTSKSLIPSSSESSPDASFYTAQTHLQLPQISVRSKVPETVRRAMAICDPESEEEEPTRLTEHVERRCLTYSDDSGSDTSEFDPYDLVLPKKTLVSKTSKPSVAKPISRSFLESLSDKVPIAFAHPDSKIYRTKYKTMKEELCKRLYKLYNEKIFENNLPDDMLIEWNTRMRNTAGFCYHKYSKKALGAEVRSSRIVLSTKVLDTPDRLRDTLVHEMCHAATWLVNGSINNGHGSYWKAWAKKSMQAFPELPPITRCHNYEIKTKFTYRCVDCGYSIGRHSKSLNTERKRCGHCKGKFELLVNKTTKNGTVQTKTPAKEPSGFALFVKENYRSVKQNQTNLKHGEVMKLLGEKFSAVKISKTSEVVGNEENDAPNI